MKVLLSDNQLRVATPLGLVLKMLTDPSLMCLFDVVNNCCGWHCTPFSPPYTLCLWPTRRYGTLRMSFVSALYVFSFCWWSAFREQLGRTFQSGTPAHPPRRRMASSTCPRLPSVDHRVCMTIASYESFDCRVKKLCFVFREQQTRHEDNSLSRLNEMLRVVMRILLVQVKRPVVINSFLAPKARTMMAKAIRW